MAIRKKAGYLRAMINRVFDDGNSVAHRGLIRGTTEGDWTFAKSTLSRWETKGYIQVLADPEIVSDDVLCVKILQHIPPED